jgi:hypothetical protein
MGTCPQLEHISYVVGLTPGFTMQAPTTIRINLGATPFKYKPRNGAQPVQAWLNDRRHRFLDKGNAEARLRDIGEGLSEVAVQEAVADGTVEPLALEHRRRMLEAEQRELELRRSPATAATWRTQSGGLARTVTFVNAPPPPATSLAMGGGADDDALARVPLRVSSGYNKAVVNSEDGCVHCLGSYPSVVADILLRSGKWAFEVTRGHACPPLPCPRAPFCRRGARWPSLISPRGWLAGWLGGGAGDGPAGQRAFRRAGLGRRAPLLRRLQPRPRAGRRQAAGGRRWPLGRHHAAALAPHPAAPPREGRCAAVRHGQ